MKYPPLPDPDDTAGKARSDTRADTRTGPPSGTASRGRDDQGLRQRRDGRDFQVGRADVGGPVISRNHFGADEATDHDLNDSDIPELEPDTEVGDIEPLLLDEGMIVADPGGSMPIPAAIRNAKARAAPDEPIPMLTEVVQVPRYDTEDLPETFAEVDWGDLAQRVRENVLERLLRRSDVLLDAQLQSTLAPILERAAESIAHEMHDTLNRMIRDIVARAVTEELTRLHAEIARRNRKNPPNQ